MPLGFVEMFPVWAQAAVWGTVAGSGLLAGMLFAKIAPAEHAGIARVMAFGAGALLGTASIHLTISARQHAGILNTIFFLCAGALLFSSVNAWLARGGGRHRKRCGECVAQDTERDMPGSGQIVAVGTIIDAIPEGLVLGIAIAQNVTPTVAVIAGFFLANIPASLSGSAGMYRAGRSQRYVLLLWLAASGVTPLAAVVGSLLFTAASSEVAGALDALAGGILLTIALETMLPEAFDKAPLFSGTIAVLGFAAIAAFAVFA